MLKYILKRILIIIPTLFVISLITFVISLNAPGDPVESMMNSSAGGGSGAGQSSKTAGEKEYNAVRKKLGLDRPVFYFSFSNGTQTDTLHRVSKKEHRESLERLSYEHGDWNRVSNWYLATRAFEQALFGIKKNKDNAKALRECKEFVYTLLKSYEDETMHNLYNKIDHLLQDNASLRNLVHSNFTASQIAYNEVLGNPATGNRYKPIIHWYGANNQYHNWMLGDVPWFGEADPTKTYIGEGFLRGDFGTSYKDKRPVNSIIWESVQLTFTLSLISMLLTYLCSIPIGVFAARRKGSRAEKSVSTLLFALYSLPNFWVGTMLIVFLCDPDYLGWFPSAYSFMPDDSGFFTKVYYLILPMFAWTYGSLAYLSRQMRGGMLQSLGQDYIRTARAKGLSERKVIWKHAFRNSLIPVITIFASVFPLAISGSIVIEMIFSIPGMGKTSIDAIFSRDYPIIFTIMMFTGILTLVGTLVSDILYAVVDPRISYSNKK